MALQEEYTGEGRSRQLHEQWEECSRCGFTYPLSQLRKQQGDGGMVTVCTVIPCYDEQSHGDYEAAMRKPVEPPLKFVDG